MLNSRRWILSSLAFALLALPLHASDWPRWLGPNFDNAVPEGEAFEPDLNKWKVAWKAEVGKGYSAVAVAGARAYTLGHDGTSQETVYCLNAATGEKIWTHSYAAKLMPDLHTGGPNATPTIVGDKVITLSKDGQVFCLTADAGKELWHANLLDVFGVKISRWGCASSAVVDGNQVLFCAGKVGALDLETGKPLWQSKTDYIPHGYATVRVLTLDGKKFVTALDGKGFSILSMADGAEIARHPIKVAYDMNATTPLVLDGGKRVFISNSGNSDMLGFDGQKLSALWSVREMRNTMNDSVIRGGAIYGVSGEQENAADALVSLNAADGKENWSQPNIGFGNLIGIGSTLLILNETGTLLTVQADPAKYTELSRRQVLEKICWTPPTYAGGRIYVRNNSGNVVVLGK